MRELKAFNGGTSSHRIKESTRGLWRRWSRAHPGRMGGIHRKLTRRERLVPEQAQRADLLGANNGQ